LDSLTPAQARALSRSAPLTPEQFRQQGRQTQRRTAPMHVLLDDVAGRFASRHRDAGT
jgi:hypothetical protein